MNSNFSFINGEGAVKDGNRVVSFGELVSDYDSLNIKSIVSPLGDRGCLSIEGTDTLKLLQGQLTCDMNQLADSGSLKGALCDNKGRMISSLICVYFSPESVMLIMPMGLVDATLETLKKYAVFYKVALTDTSDQFTVFGVKGQAPDLTEFPDVQEAGLSQAQKIVISPRSQAEKLWGCLSRQYQTAGDEYWNYLLIQAGEGEVKPETSGEFIPQMLNFQFTDAISFRKGCYTGQEIVARMHYLGKLKRRMYHLLIATAEPVFPGNAVSTQDKSDVGTVVMAADSENGKELLAVLTKEAVNSELITIGGYTGPFEIAPLPYEEKFAAGNE